MTHKFTLAAALAAAVSIVGLSSVASAADLEVLTKSNWRSTLSQSDKPVLLLVTGENCKPCDELEAVLKGSADSRTDVKFVKIDKAAVKMPDESLPYVAYSYPKSGITVSGVNKNLKSAADVDNALNVWSDSAVKVLALKAKQKELDDKVELASKPYQDQANELTKKKKEANKDVYLKVRSIRGQMSAAAKPFDDQIAALEAQREAALADLQKLLGQAEDAVDAADKPFEDEYAKLRESAYSAVKELEQEMDKVRADQRQIRSTDLQLLTQ